MNNLEVINEQEVLGKNFKVYGDFENRGYFRVIEQSYSKNGEPCINIKTLVYQKGLDYIRKILEKVVLA